MEFYITTHGVLRWLHVLAMVYWLGGEWGVFNTARYVTNINLSLDERRRHMDTAFRIDILARLGIILLLPLGLHMGYNLGLQPLGGPWITGIWLFFGAWLCLTLSAYYTHQSDLGLRLTRIDEALRYVLIPALLVPGVMGIFGAGPLAARWYAVKVTLYAILLIMGLVLRVVMRHWVTLFRSLDAGASRPAVEAQLAKEIAMSRILAYFYWVGIATVAFFGVLKPIA
jgi:hypothetical protein